MDETIYVILKVQFDFALEVWFSIYWINMKKAYRNLKYAKMLRFDIHMGESSKFPKS